ncbi:hypothetical protein GM921_09595 [Pedobacter sp. LMG 31464]|uniref:Helicase conserved C-terminal domain-containing protein n=1 Tax=Pedobacter planticolens TaxID=2679964 RepID=A0A923IW18_9SPHI|nr:helicase-related protein [Pedobacter planticolens]MBB2145739.1 hypothetical protein [Pedobacter planticolens]
MAYKQIDISSVIDLKSHDGISEKIAQRQFDVIKKGFEYLSNAENNVIYIADEVGLGKTYIGLGIATLLKHASTKKGPYCDVMVVPKKNLQDKWLKELRNFGSHNYLTSSAGHLALLENDEIIKDRLRPIEDSEPFSILRMTSFSSLSSYRKGHREYLTNEVFGNNGFCREMLLRARDLKYFNKDFKTELLKLVACLLNAMSNRIDCLIVDEAHNYKHGLGVNASNRNIATMLLLGAGRDDKILSDFPELKDRMKSSLAKKVICLSATPKDRDIMEVKAQLDCLLKKHPLRKCTEREEVLNALPGILIRGNMEYFLEEQIYSRNQCRHEHRNGNVDLAEKAVQIELGNGFDSVFWQLLQFQSIRHLSQKPNASFEIGMLAGFESYQVDMDKKVAAQTDDDGRDVVQKEYEIVQHRNQKDSEDANIIREIVNSYRKNFGHQPPPHPKLSRLETEVTNQITNQQKSLIFVRRIATVDELVKRLILRYDRDIILNGALKFTGRYTKYESEDVGLMKKAFANSHDQERISHAVSSFAAFPQVVKWWRKLSSPAKSDLKDMINYCYLRGEADVSKVINMIISTKKPSRANLSTVLHALELASERYFEQIDLEDFTAAENEEEELRYDSFFKSYFTKRHKEGFLFKQKVYRENFFDLNIFLVMLSDPKLKDLAQKTAWRTDFSLASAERLTGKRFTVAQELFRNSLLQEDPKPIDGRRYHAKELKKQTFITELLLIHCKDELYSWVSKHSTVSMREFLIHFMALNALLISIFQNGSGLLPAFVANSTGKKINKELINLLVPTDAPFHFVFQEVRTILKDYNLIISVNFQHRDSQKILSQLNNMSPVVGASGQDKNRSTIATRFRMPGFPYVLVATDIFHEGEDLHTYCQQVYHYGIAWNPSGIEQRTGRVDRINSLSYRLLNSTGVRTFSNKVQVYYPYLSKSVEVNQVVKLLGHINTFVRDFNNIENSNNYDSTVGLTDQVTEDDIPKAIQERLHSKYDIEFFQG